MEKNSNELWLRNEAASTPAQLISSVLEQRYARKSSSSIKSRDEKPDPMTFPAMQKALGSVYSTIVEIVGDDKAESEAAVQNDESDDSSDKTEENVQKLGRQLMDMVDEIGQSDKVKDDKKSAATVELKDRTADPYNRVLNSYSEPKEEIATIDISNDMAIETIVSGAQRKRCKRFRNEA